MDSNGNDSVLSLYSAKLCYFLGVLHCYCYSTTVNWDTHGHAFTCILIVLLHSMWSFIAFQLFCHLHITQDHNSLVFLSTSKEKSQWEICTVVSRYFLLFFFDDSSVHHKPTISARSLLELSSSCFISVNAFQSLPAGDSPLYPTI